MSAKTKEIDFSIFFNTSLDLLAVADKEGFLVRVNDIWTDITLFSEDDLYSKPLLDFLHPEDQVITIEMFSRILLGEKIKNFETRFIRKDNKILWLSWNASLVDDQIFMIAHETSEIKKVQNLLQDTQEVANLGGWSFDLNKEKLIWSNQTFEIFELPHGVPVEFEDQLNFFEDKSRTDFLQNFNDVKNHGKAFDTELCIKTLDGKSKWLRAKAKLDTNLENEKKVIGTYQDITAEKDLNQQLSEYRSRLSLALYSSGIGIWEWNLKTNFLDWDDKMFELYEVERQDFKNAYDAWAEVVSEDDLALVEEVLNESVVTKQDFRYEFKIETRAGRTKYIKAEARVFLNAAGEPEKMVGANWDVTEERVLESRLRESEERYELAVYGSSVGIWDWNLRDDKLYWSKKFKEICGIDEGVVPTQNLFYDLLHPEDLERTEQCIADHIRKHEPLDVSFKLIKQFTDEVVWIRLKGQAVWNIEGKALRIAGSIEDITEAKISSDSYNKSLLQFQALTETAPVGIILYDKEKGITYINQTASNITGINDSHNPKIEELCDVFDSPGKKIFHHEFVQPERLGRGQLAVSRNSEQRYAYYYSKPLIDSEDNVYGKMIVLTDITQIIQFEKELQEKESTIHTILNNTADAILTFDENGKLYNANRAVELIFNMSLSEFEMLNMFDVLLFENGVNKVGSKKSQIFNIDDLEYSVTYEMKAQRNAGEEFPVEISLGQLEIDGSRFYSVFLQDIEDRKRNEEELKTAMESATRANRTKSLFLANMSHEIRTPLNSILGMADLLIETPLNEEQLRYVRNFRDSGDSLLAIINDILDLSKVESGQLELESISFDLEYTLDQVIDLHSVNAHDKGIEILYDFDRRLPTEVMGDPYRLKQIVMNLLSNAIKFTSEGTVALKIDVLNDCPDFAKLRFSVRDTGIGIASDKLAHVFESFTQADSSTTRLFGGTGLGLNITKTLVEMMGSELHVESRLHKGSHFYFEVSLPKSKKLCPRLESLNAQDIRVLLVSENAFYEEFFNKYFIRVNAHVDFCDELSEAYKQFTWAKNEKQNYHLVVIDQGMSEMDGFEVLEQLNKSKEPMDRFLFLQNSNNTNAQILQLKQLGVSHIVNKPIKYRDWHSSMKGILDPNIIGNLLLVGDDVDYLQGLQGSLKKTKIKSFQCEYRSFTTDLIRSRKCDCIFIESYSDSMKSLEIIKLIRQEGIHIPIIVAKDIIEESLKKMLSEFDVSLFVDKSFNNHDFIGLIQENVNIGMKLRTSINVQGGFRSDISGMSVLVVDDSEKNRNLIKFYLAKSNVNLQEAENGLQAMEKFKESSFDVILMDMQMPIMDGYMATQEIRKFEAENQMKKTPILALTAFALKGEKGKSIDAGCDEHLSKPIKKDVLLKSLSNYTKGDREAA
ncbi:MAG: PAS domain S-box protein [Bdellovibrionota bacterium]|nr:PAS domain S-box protein [Bdellovibrionota bacterium]